MKFFESDVVQDELKRMQDLYVDINRMGIILTIDQKIQQLVKLLELCLLYTSDAADDP